MTERKQNQSNRLKQINNQKFFVLKTKASNKHNKKTKDKVNRDKIRKTKEGKFKQEEKINELHLSIEPIIKFQKITSVNVDIERDIRVENDVTYSKACNIKTKVSRVL